MHIFVSTGPDGRKWSVADHSGPVGVSRGDQGRGRGFLQYAKQAGIRGQVKSSQQGAYPVWDADLGQFTTLGEYRRANGLR